jgi:hypothetical protein
LRNWEDIVVFINLNLLPIPDESGSESIPKGIAKINLSKKGGINW